jgi:hypothetical protein
MQEESCYYNHGDCWKVCIKKLPQLIFSLHYKFSFFIIC